MGIGRKLLRSLLPPSWRLGRDFSAVIDALGKSFGGLRAQLMTIETESLPSSAVDTLPEWYENLGLRYDEKEPLSYRQALAQSAFTNAGGQSLDYLEAQIHIAYPQVFLKEIMLSSDKFHVGSAMVGQMQVTDYPHWVDGIVLDKGEHHSFYYYVTGDVKNESELLGLKGLLERIMPVAYEPTFTTLKCGGTPCEK